MRWRAEQQIYPVVRGAYNTESKAFRMVCQDELGIVLASSARDSGGTSGVAEDDGTQAWTSTTSGGRTRDVTAEPKPGGITRPARA